jgi:hypothetical protein
MAASAVAGTKPGKTGAHGQGINSCGGHSRSMPGFAASHTGRMTPLHTCWHTCQRSAVPFAACAMSCLRPRGLLITAIFQAHA